MSIGIVAATFWEVRRFLRQTEAYRIDEHSYRLQRWNKEITLCLSGVGRKRAQETTQKMLDSSPDLVLCTGFAGSLKPEIGAGDLVLEKEKSSWEIAQSVRALCQRFQLALHEGLFYTSDELLRTPAEKEKMAKETGAIAVEMESSAVYELCKKRGVPCIFVRAISDGFGQTLPEYLFTPTFIPRLRRDGASFPPGGGGLGWGGMLSKILSSARDWPNFFKFLLSLRKAEKNLTKFLVEFCKQEKAK